MKHRRQGKVKPGFTLLELLMVVIIIAILASLALPQYLKTVAKARRSEALNVLATIRSAEQRYKAEHAVFTNLFAKLDIDYNTAAGATNFTTGSWKYDISNADTNNSIDAFGVSGSTVDQCTMTMMLIKGNLAAGSLPKDDGSGLPCIAAAGST